MKANSCGLEVMAKLTEEEINNLRFQPILGELNFREVRKNSSKKIFMAINYSPLQREFVKVSVYPSQTYFGDSKRIDFFINEEYYQSLKEGGIADCARFCGGVGRLELMSENYNPSIASHIQNKQ